MGGAAKHMMHIHDNPDIEIDDIFRIIMLMDREEPEITFTEKLDGQNLVFTWDPETRSPRLARGSGDLASGGMDRQGLIDRFSEARLSRVQAVYLAAYDTLQLALQNLSGVDEIFNRGKRWFNAEVIGKINPNIIRYDRNAVVIHLNSVVTDPDFEANRDLLLSLLPEMQAAVENTGWRISGPLQVRLRKLEEQERLGFIRRVMAFSDYISKFASAYSMGYTNTVYSYTYMRLIENMVSRGLSLDAARYTSVRILGVTNYDLRWLKKEYPEYAEIIHDAVKNEWKVFREAQAPLAKLVNDLGAAYMKGVGSSMVDDNQVEIRRLREETRKEIQELERIDRPEVKKFLQEQRYHLGSPENIDTSIEGVVFKYNNQTYKFTGSFSAANQILGYRRYSR